MPTITNIYTEVKWNISNYLQLSTTGKLHIQLTPITVTPTNYMTWIVSRFPSGVRVRRVLLNIPHIPHDIHPSLITGTNKKLFCLLSLPVGHGRYAGSSTFINILKFFTWSLYSRAFPESSSDKCSVHII